MKGSEMYPSQYLSQDDVPEPRILHIAAVRMMEIKSQHGAEDKPAMSFQEKGEKLFILNITNYKIISAVYGKETDDWTGKPIELYTDPNVSFGGELVGGVRVRIPKVVNGRIPAYREYLALAVAAGMTEEAFKAEVKRRGAASLGDARRLAPEVIAAFKAKREQDLATEGPPVEDDTIPF